jgi:exodeoxyribonuclease VII large subunit
MLRCDELSDRLISGVQRYFQTTLMEVRFLKERLGSPQKRLELCQQKLNSTDDRLRSSMVRLVEFKNHDFKKVALQLHGLSPLAILDRGYSIVKKGQEIIKESSQVAKGDVVTIKLHKGELSSEIL